MNPPTYRHILIIGATSAIAEHCARRWLAAGGARQLTLIGRSAERLESLAADLRIRAGEGVAVRCLSGDLLDAGSIERLLDQACQTAPPDLALIAHGLLPDQEQAQQDLAQVNAALQVNAISPALFAEGLATRMAAAGQPAALGLIGSVAGDRGRKSNYIYGAAKGLLERYAEGLQHRLAATPVRVCLIKPGPTATPMTAHLQAQGAALADPARVAADIVRALAAGKAVIYTPIKWRFIMSIIRRLPRAVFHNMNI
jgi:short-subunit dehydrogenase